MFMFVILFLSPIFANLFAVVVVIYLGLLLHPLLVLFIIVTLLL